MPARSRRGVRGKEVGAAAGSADLLDNLAPRSWLRPEAATCAPSAANAIAMARPILLVAPVTRAVLFSKRALMPSSLGDGHAIVEVGGQIPGQLETTGDGGGEPGAAQSALPGLLAGVDEDFVDRHPAVTGDDVGDRVGDVFGPQWFDGFRLTLRGLPDVLTNVGDELGVDRAGLDHAHAHPAAEHLLAKRLRERGHAELGEVVDAASWAGHAPRCSRSLRRPGY